MSTRLFSISSSRVRFSYPASCTAILPRLPMISFSASPMVISLAMTYMSPRDSMLSLKNPRMDSPSCAEAFTALLMSPLIESAGRCSIMDAFSPVPRFVMAVFRYPHSGETAYGSDLLQLRVQRVQPRQERLQARARAHARPGAGGPRPR